MTQEKPESAAMPDEIYLDNLTKRTTGDGDHSTRYVRAPHCEKAAAQLEDELCAEITRLKNSTPTAEEMAAVGERLDEIKVSIKSAQRKGFSMKNWLMNADLCADLALSILNKYTKG